MILRNATVASDREGIEDAVHRFVEGIDKRDAELLASVTNVRVEIDGDQAHLTCYLIGQHHRPGQGASADYGDHLWLGNFFDSHLVREDGHVWRIRRHRVDSSWVNGSVAAIRSPS